DMINKSLNDTLSRTVITSLTTLFVVTVLFIFGGEVLKGFAFALVIGVILGTYSSLFVASALVVELQKRAMQAKS
ncbi:MAG: protein translocase subunit SecF, partial [Bacteroidetes bacterium]|nr:protein translocase subunit SecF [Bacteroidota bacterium]